MAMWSIASALLTFSVLGAWGIGIFIVPVAIVFLVLAMRRNSPWPERTVGSVAGIAIACIGVAFIHRSYAPCDSGSAVMLGPGQSLSCGGLDPLPWMIVGSTLLVGALCSYLLWKRHQVVGRPG